MGRNDESNQENPKALAECIQEWTQQSYDMSQFASLVAAANSDDKFKQYSGVIGLRKLLSNEQGPPIQEALDANIVPRLLTFAQNDQEPDLQVEAAWALTNIASGTPQQTQVIVDKGGIACFVRLLQSSDSRVAEQAIWAIGNMAGDSVPFRDMILKMDGLKHLLHIISNATEPAPIKHGVWAVSNLCRGKPLPDLAITEIAIPVLSSVFQRVTDPEVLTDAGWSLSYLSRTEQSSETVAKTGIVPALVQHLDTTHLPLLIPCLRTLGNIASGNEVQTNLVLQEPQFLSKMFAQMTNKKKAIRREVCWTISNITAGSAAQINWIMSNPVYVNTIIQTVRTDVPEVQLEAIWILGNATKNSTLQLITKMVEENNLLECFIELLGSPDPKALQVCLEGIHNILNWGNVLMKEYESPENKFMVALEEKGGVDKIENLQSHPDDAVYAKALKILETFFDAEGEEEA